MQATKKVTKCVLFFSHPIDTCIYLMSGYMHLLHDSYQYTRRHFEIERDKNRSKEGANFQYK